MAQIYIQKAVEAFKAKNKPECISNFRKALAIEPNSFTALFNLARAYQYDGDIQEAAELYGQCCTLMPSHRDAQLNYARMLLAMGKFDAGQRILEELFSKETPKQDLILALSFLALRNGDWDNARELLKIHSDWVQIDKLWWFNEDISNKTVLMDLKITPGSNGIGDAIQMLQYAEYLKKRGAHVIGRTSDYLIPLFNCCPYFDQVVSCDMPKPACYKEIPLGLQAFAILAAEELKKRKNVEPYIFPKTDLVNHWQKQLSNDPNFKIGLCWNSSMFGYYFSGTTKTPPRSIELKSLAPLTTVPGVSLYSLQKFNSKLPNLPSNFLVHQFPASIDTDQGRFMDTAAIMKNMDLIISVDTSIAHLAGAIGVPVWVILMPENDWRWLRDRTDTPWYPSMKLFRRKRLDSLPQVIELMRLELQKIIASKKNLPNDSQNNIQNILKAIDQ